MTERYKNGKIYKLVSDVSNDVYYGSTCMPLRKRFSWHKSNYLKYKQGKGSYVTSFKILELGVEICDIVLVEEYPCDNKMQLLKRERYYIENNDCINRNIPSRTDREWREANKDIIRKKGKAYRKAHKEKIRIQLKEYSQRRKYTFYCPCGGKVTVIRQRDVSRHKESIKHKSFEQEIFKMRTMKEEYDKSLLIMCTQIRKLLARLQV